MKYLSGAVPAASAAIGRPVARAGVVQLKDGRKGFGDPTGAGSAPAARRRPLAAASGMTFRGYERPLDPRIYPLSDLTSVVRAMSDIGEAGKERLGCNKFWKRIGQGPPPQDVLEYAKAQAMARIGAAAQCFDSYDACRQAARSTNNPACNCIDRRERVDVVTDEFYWGIEAWGGHWTDCYETTWNVEVSVDCLNSHLGVGACTHMQPRKEDEGW